MENALKKQENSETQVKLSPENIQILEKNISFTKKIIWLVAILFICIIVRGFFLMMDMNVYIVGGGCLITVIIMFLLIKRHIKNLERDLESGYKNVVFTQIENKTLHKTVDFVLVIEGQRHLVTKEQYEQFSKGDFVKITLTPFNKTLLEIEKANN